MNYLRVEIKARSWRTLIFFFFFFSTVHSDAGDISTYNRAAQ